ncbi:hypothetical protein [Glutamicibacter nicotianae]|uniref:hypothetical protein n=1 Tax=Glutamicibacter nicotianae TaxID=37929 RepID=UPI001CBAC360|nr:hypothetical protein [Glutamicibacter nicotianae]
MANAKEELLPVLLADLDLSEPNYLAVKCPDCEEAYGFHIDGASVVNASGQKLRVESKNEDSSARLDVQLENDPHDAKTFRGRRHAVSLLGWCEHCHKDYTLTFEQVKGTTYFSKSSTDISPE